MSKFKKETIETFKEMSRTQNKQWDLIIDIYLKLIELQRKIYELNRNTTKNRKV